ncbi:hypothetical protein J1N35_038469 [Gossypium stocksii]|uniref:Uncharacterized protein n=1 Tax=Gossypium stocksii TaxID=47602 RepID=A0A9D3UMJ1_9ROSI|nr:hypothetical protein J1N35_038469 [Gossypium stocksii]
MSKEIFEHVELIETRGRAKKASRLRDIWLTLEDRVITLEESVGDVNERVDDRITDGDDALEAMMTTLKEETAELKGELIIYKATLGNGGLVAVAPKPNEFKGARFVRDMDNFLWRMKQYFHAIGIIDDAIKAITTAMYLTDVVKDKTSHGLMFVDIMVTGRELNELVDTGASDLFMSEETTRKLGFKI